MFTRLHRQMTLFCTLVTGGILIAMTVLCLAFSERAMRETVRQSFLRDVSSAVFQLESRTVITSRWLGEIEEGRYIINIYDNDAPLLHNALYDEDSAKARDRDELCRLAIDTASRDFRLDITDPPEILHSVDWAEFTLRDSRGRNYFAAAAIFPRKPGSLGAVLILPLWEQDRQFARQRLLFAGFDLAGVAALLAFAWAFTGKLLHPVRETREKQVQFVAAASHELRSPLAVMLSNLSALEKAGPEDRPRFRESIRAEGARMSRLIDDLLALANADSHSWSIFRAPTQLDTLALNLYERYVRPAGEKGIRLTITLPEEGVPPTPCDGDRVEQAVSALISNALSYTPSGGRVDIILDRLSGGRMMFTVRDNGPGIPDSEKPKIFRRFYRVDKSRQDREHFGLGLCVAQEIAQLHRGKLWVEDAPGGGACFKMVL